MEEKWYKKKGNSEVELEAEGGERGIPGPVGESGPLMLGRKGGDRGEGDSAPAEEEEERMDKV